MLSGVNSTPRTAAAGVELLATTPQNGLQLVRVLQRHRVFTLNRLLAMPCKSEAPAHDYNAENTGQHQALVVIPMDDAYGKGDYNTLLVYDNADLGLRCLATDAILYAAHHLPPPGVPVTKAKEVLAEAGNFLEVQRDPRPSFCKGASSSHTQRR
ncbi:hypothetical protein V5799_032181 [Amblyomma americanum]|uniref:Uncharacterized protein n=1 Tax=Amblyomma americanum TaxID=6943 RepID=A0AAQ4DRW9_AMBAM